MRFPSYIHDAAPMDHSRVLVLRSNPDNLKPGIIELWDVDTGKRLFKVSAEAPLAHVLAARDTIAATGDVEGILRFWRLPDGNCLRVVDTRGKEKRWPVGTLKFLDDDRLLAASPAGFALWDVHSGKRVKTYRVEAAVVTGFAVTANADLVVTSCSDRCIRLWDVSSGKCLAQFLEPGLPKSTARYDAMDSQAASSVCLMHDGRRAVAAYGDGSLRCWDLESGDLQKAIASGKGPPWLLSVDASPTQDRIIAGSWDKHVWYWNLKDAPLPMAGHIGEAGPVFFLDGKRAVSVSFDQTIRVWNVVRRTCELVIGKPLESSRFPPNESYW